MKAEIICLKECASKLQFRPKIMTEGHDSGARYISSARESTQILYNE